MKKQEIYRANEKCCSQAYVFSAPSNIFQLVPNDKCSECDAIDAAFHNGCLR